MPSIQQERATTIVEATRLARELSHLLTKAEELEARLLLEVEQMMQAGRTIVQVSVKVQSDRSGRRSDATDLAATPLRRH